mmetsp:Transcript_22272/g.33789  ORF Transcript_22272/g.33789 Transcript_22272/m.33789 type:complete len:358 (+) Transcript_22272:62-1135(+)
MACRECHLAKVKCQNDVIPCARCVRLSLHCVRHISRQGKGRKKPRRSLEVQNSKSTEDILIKNCAGKSKLGPDHYGLNFLIRSWVWLAFSRRSFFLLNKVSTLATSYGIAMDQIFCGENKFSREETGEKREMRSLEEMVLIPRAKQKVLGEAQLDLSTVPQELLKSVEMRHSNDGSRAPSYENRWILMRQLLKGGSKYYATAAFQRDIASWSAIQRTWQANEKEVKDLWLPREENAKYAQALIHQICLHHSPKLPMMPARTAKTKIRLLSSKVEEVECAVAIALPSLDNCFYFLEYYLPENSWTKNAQATSSLDILASVARLEPDDILDGDDQGFWDSLVQAQWTPELQELFDTLEG